MTTENEELEMEPQFDLRDEYENNIAYKIRDLVRECSDLGMPVSVMCTVMNQKNEDGRDVFAQAGYSTGSPLRMGIDHLIVGAISDQGFREYLGKIYSSFLNDMAFEPPSKEEGDTAEWLAFFRAAAASCILDDIPDMAMGKLSAEVHQVRQTIEKITKFMRENPERAKDLPPVFNIPPEN